MRKRNAAVLIVAAVVLGAGAYAWAQETPTTEKPAEESTPKKERAGHRLRALRRAVHADLTIKARDGEFRTVQIDRGELVSATGTAVTLKRADGEEVTRKVDDSTRIRGAEDVTGLEDGAQTLVVAEGGTAKFVGQRKPDRPES